MRAIYDSLKVDINFPRGDRFRHRLGDVIRQHLIERSVNHEYFSVPDFLRYTLRVFIDQREPGRDGHTAAQSPLTPQERRERDGAPLTEPHEEDAFFLDTISNLAFNDSVDSGHATEQIVPVDIIVIIQFVDVEPAHQANTHVRDVASRRGRQDEFDVC